MEGEDHDFLDVIGALSDIVQTSSYFNLRRGMPAPPTQHSHGLSIV
jgi:hypothetical protein